MRQESIYVLRETWTLCCPVGPSAAETSGRFPQALEPHCVCKSALGTDWLRPPRQQAWTWS